jgi:hypothetical protein
MVKVCGEGFTKFSMKVTQSNDMLPKNKLPVWRDPRNTEVTVIGIPNKECGVNEGDIIKCIDSRKVKEWSIQKCHERLNGPAGSKVIQYPDIPLDLLHSPQRPQRLICIMLLTLTLREICR